MGAPAITAGHPEPVIVDRITRGGRRLWYHLEVIQQPERARACGAGPKSSADRRPVDPPPVVELRIFEGPSMEHAKDITFTYNANFFLFATLEHARVLAHGRLQPPSAATPPVLTGMPVSGMAYLDRPKEAGYFLFPDLSVRHEGLYRLTFNLFEQTKEFADLDKETHDGAAHTAESFDWRMEVKSNEFAVYSAKKFPGLTESTVLSRTVAEQGCRVRIRRDVRMRRREGKSSGAAVAGNGDVRAEEEYARRHRTQTPEVVADYRARSMSTESVNRTPYVPDANHAQRRTSTSDHFHSAAPSPQSGPSLPPAFGASSGGAHMSNSAHLRFGGNAPSSFAQPASVPPSPTTYSAPAHSYAQPAPPQPQEQPPQQPPQHAQHHSTSSFSAQSPAPSHTNTTSPPPNSSHSYYQDRPASQHYTTAPPPPAAPAHSPKHESFDYHRRASNSYTPAPLAIEPANDRRDSRMISPAESMTLTLPSLSEMISFQDEKCQAPPPPPSSNNTTSPNSDRVPSLSQLLLPQPILPQPSAPVSQSSGPAPQKKRSYGQYNNMDPMAEAYAANTAVKNHARQIEPPREREIEQLWWKRADGSVWTAHGEVSR